ncbi:MAG: hypothetical protein H0V70_04495 [Ktedonobacteraceae bacterium]|nr:hypothetical protein [Ktedonobacteraceae bacterium]
MMGSTPVMGASGFWDDLHGGLCIPACRFIVRKATHVGAFLPSSRGSSFFALRINLSDQGQSFFIANKTLIVARLIGTEGAKEDNGKAEIRADQATREYWHHWSH